MCKSPDPLIPEIGVITEIRNETPDVKTFMLKTKNGKKAFDHLPGQCAMLSVPGIGEAIFSVASSPTNKDRMEFSIKSVGKLTKHLHKMDAGSHLAIRGPYGNAFPVEDIMKNRDLLFIAGGIGLAPLRSVIEYVFDKRTDYGNVDILYGSRTATDLVYKTTVMNVWAAQPSVNLHLTIDRDEDDWDGHVGFVPAYLSELKPDTNKIVLVCGPPVMIKHTISALTDIGFNKKQVYTTLELKMSCGVGKCGRCNIGPKYVCIDGPVFRCDELDDLPSEY